MAQTHSSKHKVQSRRPHFSPKQLLTSEQLNQEQAFHIASLQRALYGLAGSGVVYGFKIGSASSGQADYKQPPKKGSIHISCGLAFDPHGQQLAWCGGCIDINDLDGVKPDAEGEYTLFVHYAEKRSTGSRDANECGGYDNAEDNVLWIEPCVVFSLKKGCNKNTIECFKTREGCADINSYVCEQIAQTPCYTTPEPLCPAQCAGEYYDPNHGIPLACVTVIDLAKNPEHCGSHYGFCEDGVSMCEYRSFVYRNELLYELIRGDHLNYARVEALSWQDWILYAKEWGEQVTWEAFKTKVLNNDFLITFSKPIESRTLNPGSIIFSVVFQMPGSDYLENRRLLFQVVPQNEGKFTRSVKLDFEGSWLESEVKTEGKSLLVLGLSIELTIRGSLVRDECGCMLDARPLGYVNEAHACCQSMPGGDFIAVFRVASK